MKTIRIRSEVKSDLDEFAKEEGKSVNKAVGLLVDSSDSVKSRSKRVVKYSNIQIDDDTFSELGNRRLYDGETYSEVIARLLKEHRK